MPAQIVVVENKNDWKTSYPKATIVLAKDYISQHDYYKQKDIRVINLCKSYRYLSIGYYVSLLAEARSHKVIPTVRTITDLKSKSIYGLSIEDMHELLQKNLKSTPGETDSNSYSITVLFGLCEEKIFPDLCRQLFDLFRSPILKIEFKLNGSWQIASIRPGSIQNLTTAQEEFFIESYSHYITKRWNTPKAKSLGRYDMAILYNPDEKLPPSNMRALKKFITAGEKLGIEVDLITKKDFSRLAEYDALFIRETTEIEHHTYRFARRAENEGIIVIDDPESIMKCTNKIYLAEMLAANNIPTPITEILKKDEKEDLKSLENKLTFPLVLKIPDSSFSRGVHKAENYKDLNRISAELFTESDVILAQEYLYTSFDWRVVVLNNEPIFACQYFMSRHHWQIVKHGPEGSFKEGSFKTWNINDVPPQVIKIALQAANMIGNGLYGVDLKQIDQRVVVIEVNDNPNIDAGIEDKVIGDELYSLVIKEFIRRLDAYMDKNKD